MSIVVSGGELRDLSDRYTAAAGYPTSHVPRLDKQGNIVDIERVLAGLGDPDFVYRTQPAVRAVVDFRVSRFVRVPLHAYVRQSDTDRQPLADGDALSQTLREPLVGKTQAQFIADLLYDWYLHDRWLVMVGLRAGGGYDVIRLPAHRWRPWFDGLGRVTEIRVDGGRTTIDPASCIFDHGRGGGVSPMHTLQDVLLEMVEGGRYRRQTWNKAGRHRTYIHRPADAPDKGWGEGGRDQFVQDFRAAWSGDGPEAGGSPLLEDGMELRTVNGFSAADLEYLEGLRLDGIFVCSVWQTPPEMIGLRQGNYSNMDAFRQSLYRETLGGDYVRVEQKLQELVPRVTGAARAYVEFLVEAALRGSFEEQARMVQSLVGRPIYTGDEGRALFNKQALGGNMAETVTPLNVLIGGLASPRDTAPPAKSADTGEKAEDEVVSRVLDPMRERLAAAIRGVFASQRSSVDEQLAAKADGPPAVEWDKARWDRELRNVLLGHGQVSASLGAQAVLAKIDPSYDWKDEPMLPWLAAAAENIAARVNDATVKSLTQALEQAEWADAVKAVFDQAEGVRAETLGRDVITETAGFGSHEAAKATGARTKTWIVTSTNPRPSHAALNGVTVPFEESFANGCRYPGDGRGGADEFAGCTCAITYGTGGEA